MSDVALGDFLKKLPLKDPAKELKSVSDGFKQSQCGIRRKICEFDLFETIIDGIRFGLIPNPEFGLID